MKSHRAALILVLGILGLVGCLPCAPIAWLMGNADLDKMRDGAMDPSGAQLTNLGRFLGMVVTVLMLVCLCGGVALRLLLGTR